MTMGSAKNFFDMIPKKSGLKEKLIKLNFTKSTENFFASKDAIKTKQRPAIGWVRIF